MGCRQKAPGPPRPQLLLGRAGLDIQVLRGDHDRPAPQGDHARPQGQLDVPPRDEAPRTPRPHRRREALQRHRQGQEVYPNQGRLQEGVLAQEELSQAPQKAIRRRLCYSCCLYLQQSPFPPMDLGGSCLIKIIKNKNSEKKKKKKKIRKKKKKKKKKK